jgi:hypothetical protein
MLLGEYHKLGHGHFCILSNSLFSITQAYDTVGRYQHFRATCCFILKGRRYLDDGGSRYLLPVVTYLSNYMMPYPEGPNLNIQKIMQAFMGLTFYN